MNPIVIVMVAPDQTRLPTGRGPSVESKAEDADNREPAGRSGAFNRYEDDPRCRSGRHTPAFHPAGAPLPKVRLRRHRAVIRRVSKAGAAPSWFRAPPNDPQPRVAQRPAYIGLVKIHLVDGTFELFRCFNGAPRATNRAGEEVGASRAFVHTLVALLRRDDVTHVAVTFDTIVDAPLAPSPDDGPWNQHSIAAEITRALGIVLWPMIRRYEADDALASAAAKYAGAPGVDQIVICTRDKDLAQCVVGDRVVMLDRVNDVVTDEKGVIARWGVPPPLIPSLLALTGDKADGLPGLPGWGPKSAAALLNRYGAIERIPVNADDWEVAVRGATRLAAVLNERRSEALLYRDLIKLATDVPLRQTVADLLWHGARRGPLETVAARIGAEDVVGRVPRWRSDP